MITTPLGEQAFKCFGDSHQCDQELAEECSRVALAAAAFLTPRLHEFRDLHSGREDRTRPTPS